MVGQSRQYQTDLDRSIHDAWDAGNRNVLATLPTGGGKTWVFSGIIKKFRGHSIAIAHRQEIVAQIALSLGKHGVQHKIIAPKNVIQLVNRMQSEELGRSFYHPSAPVAVAGVDTLIARQKRLGPWVNHIGLWVMDEAHHILKSNKWGKAARLFPQAKGLGVTATPTRADGKGLGAHHDGVFDTMVHGPGMRDLINMGYLADYRIFAPPSDIRLDNLKTGSNGDWTRPGVVKAVRTSRVIGDVVAHYLRIAPGKLGITFAPDVQTASDIARQFNEAGVPAAVCTADTPDIERSKLIKAFKARKILQLVNVDLFGEGFDVPGVEVVSMARPTMSYGLYCQQFGRALRPDGSKIAIIIDHVGNVVRHGLPDRPREWTLDRRERNVRREGNGEIPVRACPECTAVYERIQASCPYCGYKPEPAARSGPEFVDGDLNELDPVVLARMRGGVVDTSMTTSEYLAASGAGSLHRAAAMGAAARFREKQAAQVALRESMALWAGYQGGIDYGTLDRLFYHLFGVDRLTAQALKRKEAEELKILIDKHVNRL